MIKNTEWSIYLWTTRLFTLLRFTNWTLDLRKPIWKAKWLINKVYDFEKIGVAFMEMSDLLSKNHYSGELYRVTTIRKRRAVFINLHKHDKVVKRKIWIILNHMFYYKAKATISISLQKTFRKFSVFIHYLPPYV